eukprot:3445049-Amphidinium_carterae.1
MVDTHAPDMVLWVALSTAATDWKRVRTTDTWAMEVEGLDTDIQWHAVHRARKHMELQAAYATTTLAAGGQWT